MLVGFIWAVMGTAVVRTYAFLIGFLFFMVPIGEFLFPTMMQWTADFIIWRCAPPVCRVRGRLPAGDPRALAGGGGLQRRALPDGLIVVGSRTRT